MSDKTYQRGHFVWRELMTPDIDAAKAFYGGLFGWTFDDMPMATGEGVYTVVKNGDFRLAGMMTLASIGKEDIQPYWMSYVSMANVDETAAAASANGGTVALEPKTVPSVGLISVIGDAQHAYTSIVDFEPGDPPRPERPGVGMFCWEQLDTSDVDSAVAFYRKVYGWEKRGFGAGDGEIVTFYAGETPVAAVMQTPPGVPPHWMTYVVVENLSASRERVRTLGGQVTVEAIPVPRIGTIAVINDPHGASIGLFEPSA